MFNVAIGRFIILYRWKWISNAFEFQAGFPPVIIRKQDRLAYYNHLQTASDGDTRPFIRFIAHCTEKIIDVYLWATKDHRNEIEQQDLRTSYSVEKTEEAIYDSVKSSFPKIDFDDGHLWLSEKDHLEPSQEGRFARVRMEDDIFDREAYQSEDTYSSRTL